MVSYERIHVVQVWEVVEMKNLVMEMEGKNVEQLDLFAYYSFGRSWFSRGSILI